MVFINPRILLTVNTELHNISEKWQILAHIKLLTTWRHEWGQLWNIFD